MDMDYMRIGDFSVLRVQRVWEGGEGERERERESECERERWAEFLPVYAKLYIPCQTDSAAELNWRRCADLLRKIRVQAPRGTGSSPPCTWLQTCLLLLCPGEAGRK